MASIREIQEVASTMATVAAAKLAKTRRRAAGMREYAGRLRSTVRRVQASLELADAPLAGISPFLVPAKTRERLLLLHLAGDRGMCGDYNISVNREARRFLEESRACGAGVQAICVGWKGSTYLRARNDLEILHSRKWPRLGVTEELVDETHVLIRDAFLEGRVDEVWCSYTRFITPARREPRLVKLLPISPEQFGQADAEYARPWETTDYEPEFESVVPDLIAAFLLTQVEDVLLESYASEQGARMVAMEEATERAKKSLRECTVQMNRFRREFITTDLLGMHFMPGSESRDNARARG